MTNIQQSTLADINIERVWQDLGGTQPKRGRAPAFWRDSKDANVSLVADRGVWFDHVQGEGGGVLTLVETVLGSSRPDALAWLELHGYLTPQNLTRDELNHRTAERRELARYLPAAHLWRRAAINLFDELLVSLKAALFDPTLPQPGDGEILSLERLRTFFLSAQDRDLVAEFQVWRDKWPETTAAMIRAARKREQVERRALMKFVEGLA